MELTQKALEYIREREHIHTLAAELDAAAEMAHVNGAEADILGELVGIWPDAGEGDHFTELLSVSDAEFDAYVEAHLAAYAEFGSRWAS